MNEILSLLKYVFDVKNPILGTTAMFFIACLLFAGIRKFINTDYKENTAQLKMINEALNKDNERLQKRVSELEMENDNLRFEIED